MSVLIFNHSFLLIHDIVDVINESPDKVLIMEYLMSNDLPVKTLSLDDQLFALFTQMRHQPNKKARQEWIKTKKQQYRESATKTIFRAIFVDSLLRNVLAGLFEFPGFTYTSQLSVALLSKWVDTRGVIGGVSRFHQMLIQFIEPFSIIRSWFLSFIVVSTSSTF